MKSKKINMWKYIGNQTQLFGIKEYTFSSGKARGLKAFDVRNGSGLEFTVLADRCLDIAHLYFKGTNCSYISKAGIVSPEFNDESGTGFFRNFYGGFLTTCGLRNVGPSCVVDGEYHPIHGRISNTPAEEVSATVDWKDDAPMLTVSGKMREARLFGENFILNRIISCKYAEKKFFIHDSIENRGFREESLMLLYHFNFGYPLLDEDAELIIPTAHTVPRDDNALKGMDSFNQFQKPTPNFAEQVFYHDLLSESEGRTCAALINRKHNLGVALHFNKNQFFNFTQWKQMGEGDYVLGLEPCNCYVDGRLHERNKGKLDILKPGEIKEFKVEVEILDGIENINAFAQKIKCLSNSNDKKNMK